MSTDSSIMEVSELEKMLKPEKEQWERRSIYKLPPCVTNASKTAYTPQIVSFGPYHYEDENLKRMEWHKKRAVTQFLNRSKLTYDDCRQSLSEIVGELMDAYDWLDTNLYNKENPDAFLKIMIRDGIFMLEIFGDGEEKALGYADNDPIFSKHGDVFFTPHIKRDMLILENQIPIKVLHRLYHLQYPGEDANKVVFQFFFPNKYPSKLPTNISHILDLYRTVMIGSHPTFTTEEEKQNIMIIGGDDVIRTAVELNDAGIRFKKSRTNNIRDISFKNGVLQLPMIIIDDTTESLFLNLVAYEQFHVGAGKDVTAYAFFMDNIIDDASDIKLLHSNDIIQNGIGSDKVAAKFFKSLSKGITLDKTNPMAAIYRNVNAHSKRRIQKYRAELCHTYFTNPWAIISFIAAIFLFVLTTTETTFGVMGFYKKD